MIYTAEALQKLETERARIGADLQQLFLRCVLEGQSTGAGRAKGHILHGAGRRLSVLRAAMANIFELFPPSTERPLSRDVLTNVQINLHAFVMNLYGVFENWAWAYVLRHGLDKEIKDRQSISLFKTATQKRLPLAVRTYLQSETMTTWCATYLKNYRDALAHRIPLYIPPAAFTPEEGHQYNALDREKGDAIKGMKWDRLKEIYEEEAKLGRPAAWFLHSLDDEERSRPVRLHEQPLCDAATVVEFGNLFFDNWTTKPA
jgi:hypothetical protein